MPHIALKAIPVQVIGEDGKRSLEIRQPGEAIPEANLWRNPGVWVRRGDITDKDGYVWRNRQRTGKRFELKADPSNGDGADETPTPDQVEAPVEAISLPASSADETEPPGGAGETDEPEETDPGETEEEEPEDDEPTDPDGEPDDDGDDGPGTEENDDPSPLEPGQDEADTEEPGTKAGGYTEEDLDELTKATLIEIAGLEFELALTRKISKPKMIEAIMEAQG